MKPIEIKIPKEVTQHKETIFFGLSVRQFFCSMIAVAMAASIYLLLHSVIGKDPASWLCMICAAPFAVAGFFSYNGLTFEQFIWVFLKSYIGVCMEGAIVVLACLIYSAFLSSSTPAANGSLPAVTMVWQYIGQMVFNMLILTGLVKGASQISKEMFGLH